MIVECTECRTRFQLDESRVPASGIRVRCSRCKHAFFLKPPGRSRDEEIHEVAAEAAAAGSVPPPRATQDLPGAGRVASGGGRGSGSETDDEESDWEFNEEVPDPSAREESRRGARPPAKDTAPPPKDTGPPPTAATPESDFGADDLESEGLSSLGGSDPQVDPLDGIDDAGNSSQRVEPTYTGRPGSGERDETAFGSVDELGDLGADDAGATAARASGGEELDDPESWDFFGDSPASAASGARMSIGVIGRAAADASDSADTASFPGASDEPVGLDTLPTPSLGPGRLTPWLAGVGNGLGWLATLGLLAFGLANGLRPAWRTAVDQGVPSLARGLQPEGVAVHWLESARLGRLMVVTGGLRAPGGRATAPVGAIELALLDTSGRPLSLPGTLVGAPLPEFALREWTADALERGRSRAALDLASREIAPGQLVPFQAVVAEVPFEAQRFDLREAPPAESPEGAAAEEPVPDQERAEAASLDFIESAAEAGSESPRR